MSKAVRVRGSSWQRCLASCLFLAFWLACLLGSVAIADDPLPGEKEFDSLRARYVAESERFFADLRQVKSEEERTRLINERYPANTMVDEFLQLEEQHRGTLVGLSALYQLVSAAATYGAPEANVSKGRKSALKILTADYADHPDLDLFFFWLAGGSQSPEAKSFLRRAADSPQRHVRGTALLTLAELLKIESQAPLEADTVLDLAASDNERFAADIKNYKQYRQQFIDVVPETSRLESLHLIDRVLGEYADVLESPRTTYGPILLRVERTAEDPLALRKRRTLAELASSLQFELTHLTIGQPAPDIAGPDAFGHELKLSDQRGKVIVLMFSFKGCGPCEGMYPDNRKLIEANRERPFAFLGVMGDDELVTVKEAVAQGTITWRVWWDGKKPGPIVSRWNVSAWPEIYVLDHKGVIRYRELRGELLDRAVSRLLESAERDQ